MDSYESITRRYAPHSTEVILFFVAEEEEVQEIPSYPHLQLVVNKPARTKRTKPL